MELSPLVRNLIARATAFSVGLCRAYPCYRCLVWAESIRTDPLTADQYARTGADRRRGTTTPLILPYAVGGLFGLGAIVLVGFAVTPTQLLHQISPKTWEVDAGDAAGVFWP